MARANAHGCVRALSRRLRTAGAAALHTPSSGGAVAKVELARPRVEEEGEDRKPSAKGSAAPTVDP
eukprot:1141458-Alexandrium_andersonii.AAC.1